MTDHSMMLTLSTNQAHSFETKPLKRSIFPEYWKHTRTLQEMVLSKPPLSPLSTSPTPQDDGSDRTAQSPLAELPAYGTTVRDRLPFIEFPASASVRAGSGRSITLVKPRRIIMPYRAYTSSPPRHTDDDDGDYWKASPSCPQRNNISSNKLIEEQPARPPSLGSCLRENRFSTSSTTLSTTSSNGSRLSRKRSSSSVDSESSTVRFDMENVNVIHFEKPQENYSEQGWVQHFA